MQQVVMVSVPRSVSQQPLPTYETLMSNKQQLWSKYKWAGGVFARMGDVLAAAGQSTLFELSKGARWVTHIGGCCGGRRRSVVGARVLHELRAQ